LGQLPEQRTTLEQAVDLRLEIRNVLVQLGDFPRIRACLLEATRTRRESCSSSRRRSGRSTSAATT